MQGKTAERQQDYSENDTNIVRSKDTSNTALQFSGKRHRLIHIDNQTNTITPVTEWTTNDLREIVEWVRTASASHAESTIGTFRKLQL